MVRRAAVAALVVVAALVAPVGATAPASATTVRGAGSAGTDQQRLYVNYTLSLTPADPGSIEVHAGFDIPEDVTSLTARVPAAATVTASEGFVRRTERKYDWQGTTQEPSLTYDLAVNHTASGEQGGRTGYFYVDAGEWAIVRSPQVGITYSGYGERPPIVRDVRVDGQGVAGSSLSYLGPHETYASTAADQRFRLVVPRAADMVEPPGRVLRAVGEAARALDVGERDEEVLMIAAPTTVDWGSVGLQLGDADFWVRDVQRLDSPNNAWLHEYVHTRQEYRTTDATRWTVEGFADYYAALLSLRQGRIDYATFRDHLRRGTRYDDAVLADPATWQVPANYRKGALVAGAVDRQVRLAGGNSLDAAFRRMNRERRLNESEFLAAVAAAGDGEVREYARRYTVTDAVPETWGRAEHTRAFDGLPAFDYALVGYRVTGPYRNATYEEPPTLVPGETLHVRARVTNDGDATGDYEATLLAGGVRVGTERGTLAPGESARLTYAWTPEATGSAVLELAGERATVAVRSPADPGVRRLRAPDRVATGERFVVRAVVAGADRPAEGVVRVRAGGSVVARERVRLAPGEETTVRARVRFAEPGTYRIAAGEKRGKVRVRASDASATPTPTAARSGGDATTPTDGGETAGSGTPTPADGTRTPGAGPGFGALAALLTVALLSLARR